MKENSNKVLSFPARVPAKADYQRVKSNYSLREIKELFGLSERTIRRWHEQGIIQGTPGHENDYNYDFQALTQFRRVRDLRAQGHSIRQIEAELQGQLNLFLRVDEPKIARLRTPFEEALVLDDQNDPRAIDSYLEAIDNGDNVAEAYCNLGIINKDLGNVGVALDNFTLALNMNRDTWKLITTLAIFISTPVNSRSHGCITKPPLKSSRAFRWSTSILRWPTSS